MDDLVAKLVRIQSKLHDPERWLWKQYSAARAGDPVFGVGSPGEQAYQDIFEARDELEMLLDAARESKRRKAA